MGVPPKKTQYVLNNYCNVRGSMQHRELQKYPKICKDTLAASWAMGNERKSNGHQPLNQVIIQALIGKLYCIL